VGARRVLEGEEVMVFFVILLVFSLVCNFLMGWLLYKASRKLLQFDDLINYLVDDVETNVAYFDKLTATPVLSNAPEIQEATKNMTVMSARLDEYLNRFAEITGKNVRKASTPKLPVVVD
jgi:hypothetical protein